MGLNFSILQTHLLPFDILIHHGNRKFSGISFLAIFHFYGKFLNILELDISFQGKKYPYLQDKIIIFSVKDMHVMGYNVEFYHNVYNG